MAALESLPRAGLSSGDLERLDSYTLAHSLHFQRKQVLLQAVIANALSDATDRELWLGAWKEEPAVQQMKTAELDDLAAAFGAW